MEPTMHENETATHNGWGILYNAGAGDVSAPFVIKAGGVLPAEGPYYDLIEFASKEEAWDWHDAFFRGVDDDFHRGLGHSSYMEA